MNDFESDANQIIHFFEMEIELNKRIEKTASPMFNDVNVGFEKAEELRKAYIRYCQNIIDRIRSDSL